MQIEEGVMTASIPPMYRYHCPKCGEMEFDTKKYPTPEVIKETTTIEKIRSEAERLKKETLIRNSIGAITGSVYVDVNDLLSFLDTLEAEEMPEPKSAELKEEVRKYMSERWKLGCTPITPVCLPNFTTDDLKECAEFFYKLGLISKK